ncbi:MAG TPA: hypothetical protein VFX86_02535 [Candidatus Saccharimonadales bacterium]|nr:hypothetical protein [Candidatus Saccharimonadales bacterium]
MPEVMEQGETGTAGEAGGLRFDDELTEAMVATASGYFFAGSGRGDEDARHFREAIRNFYQRNPNIARMVLAAGLLESGFKIETGPNLIDTPDEENPEHALDRRLFMENWYNVAPTVLGLGWRATSKESEFFNQQTVDFVREEVG